MYYTIDGKEMSEKEVAAMHRRLILENQNENEDQETNEDENEDLE